MTRAAFAGFTACLLLLAAGAAAVRAGEPEAPRMAKEELKAMLGDPGLVILDVRSGGDKAMSRIPGAVHEDPEAVDSWAGKYAKDRTLVLYCA